MASFGVSRMNMVTNDHVHLNGYDFHPCRIPSLPLPSFDAHRAKTEQTDGSIAFSHLDTIDDFRVGIVIRVVGVDPALARQR